MKALLVHPKDSPRRGPWAGQSWNLVVDLGMSSESVARAWEKELGCPVLRLAMFRRRVEDPRAAGQLLRSGWGRVLDEQGLDWWELTSLLIHAELETLFALRRLLPDLRSVTEFHATRSEWPVDALEVLLGRTLTNWSPLGRSLSGRIRHYGRLWRTQTPSQLTQILLDKHDADFRWRARWTPRRRVATQAVTLVPTAYTNVSRLAAAYAQLLPEQTFLFVYTRGSGTEFRSEPNITVAPLASYAGSSTSAAELSAVREKWDTLRRDLESIPEFQALSKLGLLHRFPIWFSDGLAARDAWLEVFRREPVQAVLCGDDSNWYTRVPVLLGRARSLPTIDFHHGALDGRFLLKDLSSDVYLAKSPMEMDYLTRVCELPRTRIELGAPRSSGGTVQSVRDSADRDAILFFSEPYENFGGRSAEIYRELLPPLATLAENSGRRLLVKLHPFESLREREALVRQILLGRQHRAQVLGGPLSSQLVQSAWFGITFESTTVIECAAHGVPCFLAAWIADSHYGYVQQYVNFGMGTRLSSPEELLSIPSLLAKPAAQAQGGFWQPMHPDRLRALLAGGQTQSLNGLSATPQQDRP